MVERDDSGPMGFDRLLLVIRPEIDTQNITKVGVEPCLAETCRGRNPGLVAQQHCEQCTLRQDWFIQLYAMLEYSELYDD